jgi:DNA-binding winged helix-turn-helix (wHTH) protein
MTGAGAYRFGDFTLDCNSRQLLCQGEAIHLSPKAFELLQVLVEATPRALSKAELQDRIWPDTFVVEANLQHLITEIRRALRDNRHQPQYLRTVFGFGYAFHQATALGEGAATPLAAGAEHGETICRLGWDDGRVALADGEYTVGRDGTADVVLDSTTVSRHHARLRVSQGTVVLEDLGSKNGTFVCDRRVHGTVTLNDGDDLRFGNVPVSIRIGGSAVPTESVVRTSGVRDPSSTG